MKHFEYVILLLVAIQATSFARYLLIDVPLSDAKTYVKVYDKMCGPQYEEYHTYNEAAEACSMDNLCKMFVDWCGEGTKYKTCSSADPKTYDSECGSVLYELKVKFHMREAIPELAWNTRGFICDYDFSCWKVHDHHPFKSVSCFGVPGYQINKDSPYHVSVTGANTNDVFKRPLGFDLIWNPSPFGFNTSTRGANLTSIAGSFWSVNCPIGYGALSDVCTDTWRQPPWGSVWCVNHDYLDAELHDSWIWRDLGSWIIKDCIIYGGGEDWTHEIIAVTNKGKPEMWKIASKYLDFSDPIYTDYKFVGGCEKGEECFEGFVCGGTGNYGACNHCSFDECNERAMENRRYAFAYKQRDKDTKKGVCKLCNDKEFSKFERGQDNNHKGWGLYTIKLGMNHGPCGDAHECQGGFECKDKKENGYGTCK